MNLIKERSDADRSSALSPIRRSEATCFRRCYPAYLRFPRSVWFLGAALRIRLSARRDHRSLRTASAVASTSRRETRSVRRATRRITRISCISSHATRMTDWRPASPISNVCNIVIRSWDRLPGAANRQACAGSRIDFGTVFSEVFFIVTEPKYQCLKMYLNSYRQVTCLP